MKRLLMLLLLIPSTLRAAPYLVSDYLPANAGITHFNIQMDSGAKVKIPAFTNTTGARIHYDLGSLGLSTGFHQVKASSVVDSIWGDAESAMSATLIFLKPASPTAPYIFIRR